SSYQNLSKIKLNNSNFSFGYKNNIIPIEEIDLNYLTKKIKNCLLMHMKILKQQKISLFLLFLYNRSNKNKQP
ncbi:MAG TPA: hypothetical protein VJ583_00495, partial [Nitrososphaeraceae archaeon]|nr:hypothetical protein [Nitrososphaeraceae archaeon]